MKIHYHPKSRIKSLYKGKLIFIVSLFAVCIIFFSIFDGGLIRIATPAWLGNSSLVRGTSNFFNLVHSKQVLINENTDLKSKLESDELELSVLRSFQNQDNLVLETFKNQKIPHINATVVARPPQTLFDTVVVDAGENLGVRVDDYVYMPEGALIGTISDVFMNNSKVKLFSTSGEEMSAVLERDEVTVNLIGRGGGAFEANVSRDTLVVVGDRVLSGIINAPLIGVVEDVEMVPTDSFKKVLIRSVANLFNLHFVSIAHE